MHKISNDEINITKDIKIKDIRCNNKFITNIVEFNLTISHSIKYFLKTYAGFGMVTLK